MRRLKPLCEITARQSSTGRQSPLSEGQTNIWTVGHSTLTIGDFLEMLSSNGIRALAEVRRFPASRRHPQFNQDELRESLAAAGIEYLHLPELGGRRQARPDSRNTVWRNPSFRGYADYSSMASLSRCCLAPHASQSAARPTSNTGTTAPTANISNRPRMLNVDHFSFRSRITN